MNRFDESSPHQVQQIGGNQHDPQQLQYQRNPLFEQNYAQAQSNSFQEQDYGLAEYNQNIQNIEYESHQGQDPCRQRCTQNLKKMKQVVDQLLQNKYEEQFTFYFSKPINELLSNYPTHHVVLFKEYLFIDDENEYLKRFYFGHEHKQRLNQLFQFYSEVFPSSQPNMYALDVASIMIKRNNALDKIFFLENERKMRQPPETQREQNPPAQEDLYLESHSSLVGQPQDNLQDFDQDNNHHYNNEIIDLGNQYLHQHHLRYDKPQVESDNMNDIEFQLSNQQAIEYYNEDMAGINLYNQQQIRANQQGQSQQSANTPQQKNSQKLRSRDAELKKQQYQKHSPRNHFDIDGDEAKIAAVDISTPRKDPYRTKSHSSQAQRNVHKENRDDRKKIYKNKDSITPRANSEGLFCETPRDDFKFNQQNYKESPQQQDNIREAFMLANSNSQKRNKEQQRRDWDAQNRAPLHKNGRNEIGKFDLELDIDNINNLNGQQQLEEHNYQMAEEDDVQEMFNILHQQNQKNQQNHPFRRKTTDSEFEDALGGGQNDFSLHSHEFMDQREEDGDDAQQQYFLDNQKFYQNQAHPNKFNHNYQHRNDNYDNYDDDDQQENNQMFQEFKGQSQDNSSQYNKYEDDDENDEDYKQFHSDHLGKEDNLFGAQGSFMKDLNQYEKDNSFETETFDVFNPSFSSEQNESQTKQILRQEEQLFMEVWDVKDIDDLMERYAIGKDESGYICRCAEFAQNKENFKNILFEEQEKAHSARRQIGNEERGILRQQNSQTNSNKMGDNSDINVPKMICSNDIAQLKKAASTSLSQGKNHSSTPSNQNNYPSSSSMKSSHHHHQQQQSLQPEDYQFLILQQSLQQQIQQQQQNLQNNPPQQKSKSSLKQQRSSDIPKYGVDLSPRNLPYVMELNELSPNYQKNNQNFNEMLQAQIQNQMAIKQKLEQSKAENSTSNKMIEQNQQYYSNYSSKAENIIPQQQIQQSQQLHQSSSSNTLGNQMQIQQQQQQQQSSKNNQNSNTSLTNQKNLNYHSINFNNTSANNNISNNQTNQLLMQQLLTTNSSASILQQTKPAYNNTKKKLANQLQSQNQHNGNHQNQANTSQSKNIRQNDFYLNNNQQNNSLSGNYNQNNQFGDASSNSLMATLNKNAQIANEQGNIGGSRSKFFDTNQLHHLKKQDNSSTYNTLDSTKKPISSLIEQSSSISNQQINQPQQNQSSKLKINPSTSTTTNNNNASSNHNNLLLNSQQQSAQTQSNISGLTQQMNQNKNNLANNKIVNSSTQNLKNNSSKGHNVSPQHQLDMLAMTQSPPVYEKSNQYKAFNQMSQQFSNNQSKLESKNIVSSLAASTSSSQKGFSNQQHYQQISQHNTSSKGRAKMHGKEKRNTSTNQSNPGSISLTNIKKQSFLNQIDPPLYNQQTNSLVKSHHIHPHSESQQQDMIQYFQSSSDSNKFHSNNLLSTLNDKKNEQTIFGSPQDNKVQSEHHQYISPPQKRQIEKPITQLSGASRFTNKSISHSTNLFSKEEGIRNSQAMQSNGHKRNSLKKSSELLQGVGNNTADINWHPALMKQGSKDQINQKSIESSNTKSQHPILVQNSVNKPSALNIEVQRRISLKHLKIKENNHFLGVNKNISIEKEQNSQGQTLSRLDETNLSKKQNSFLNKKRFPHLNNSVGDPSPIEKKQDASNAASIIDSHRELQYSNNPHHNQIVQSLLTMNQINPHTEQIGKKPSLNFLPSNKSNNQHNINSNQYVIESASKLAINIYQQTLHKNNANTQNQQQSNAVSLPTNNSYNYSRSFVQSSNQNNQINNNLNINSGNGLSQSNSRLNSQEKMFSRPSKNKSLDENNKKNNSKQLLQGQPNNVVGGSHHSNINQNVRQQQSSPSSSLPHQQYQQYYYPQSSSSQQMNSNQTQAPPPKFMSPQLNYTNSGPLNQYHQSLSSGIQNKFSIDNSTDQNLPYLNPTKQFNLDSESHQVNQQTLQSKNRNKQHTVPFNNPQISQSLQQSQHLTHQYKTSTSNQQTIQEDPLKIDNQISSPRFKKIKSNEKLYHQNQDQQQQQQNQIQGQNISASQSSTPSQSNLSSQQQQTATFNNIEKEKVSNNKNPKPSQKKQLLHHSQSTNINTIKKNNFMKQQEILRASQQQHTSIGDGVSQNSSYGFLTSRSQKKTQKEGQNGQKMNVQDSPYNMDGIKRDTNKFQPQQLQQQQQQQQQQLLSNQNNFVNPSNPITQINTQKQNSKVKSLKYNQVNKVILPENQEEGQSSSRQDSAFNQEMAKFYPTFQGNLEFDPQELITNKQQQLPTQLINNYQVDQYVSGQQPLFYNGNMNQNLQQQLNLVGKAGFANQSSQQQQVSQQSAENYNKIKYDLKQNALDIIKTQKRKK